MRQQHFGVRLGPYDDFVFVSGNSGRSIIQSTCTANIFHEKNHAVDWQCSLQK